MQPHTDSCMSLKRHIYTRRDTTRHSQTCRDRDNHMHTYRDMHIYIKQRTCRVIDRPIHANRDRDKHALAQIDT